MRINVTWEDIRAGKSMRTSECMVALALKRELGLAYVSVGLNNVRVRTGGRCVTLALPSEVSFRIRCWELFRFMLPFTFEFGGLGLWFDSTEIASSSSSTSSSSASHERSASQSVVADAISMCHSFIWACNGGS